MPRAASPVPWPELPPAERQRAIDVIRAYAVEPDQTRALIAALAHLAAPMPRSPPSPPLPRVAPPPAYARALAALPPPASRAELLALYHLLEERALRAALEAAGWRPAGAAQLLGVPRRSSMAELLARHPELAARVATERARRESSRCLNAFGSPPFLCQRDAGHAGACGSRSEGTDAAAR